jgi:ABC-type multidrug transport system fused ATPase/permease subunit
MIALVGRSGAGKTTLVDVLMGFYEPTSGAVLVDGVPLQDLDINSWRGHIGFVPQDAFLFNMSLRENLLWSKTDATEEQLRQACLQANAIEFIEKLPQGYDTLVGERGVRLSGGQRQRIALARALLRQPEVLILDEATSALDSHSERMIQESIEKISQHTTIVVIAHRLSTIQKADCIYVLDEGRVVESGSFGELMRRDGNFLEMAQLQGFEEKEELPRS